MLLASALGWEMEVAVPTKQPRGSGYPTCYKIDIGNKTLRVGVEVDGASHFSLERQLQDRKKEELLQSLGWKVLRFSNEDVIRNLTNCVQAVRSSISK
jgi:very-short-patch-repair endonuclease